MVYHVKLRTERATVMTTDSKKLLWRIAAIGLTMVIAILCYSLSVYAWFQASIVNTGNIIQTADYGLTITVTGPEDTRVEPENGAYPLEGGKDYSVELTATGTASAGYCVVKAGNSTYYTEEIAKGATLSFTLHTGTSGSCTFTAAWGKHDGTADITDEKEIHILPQMNNAGAAINRVPGIPTETAGTTEAPSTAAPTEQAEPTDTETADTTQAASGETGQADATTAPSIPEGTEPTGPEPAASASDTGLDSTTSASAGETQPTAPVSTDASAPTPGADEHAEAWARQAETKAEIPRFTSPEEEYPDGVSPKPL